MDIHSVDKHEHLLNRQRFFGSVSKLLLQFGLSASSKHTNWHWVRGQMTFLMAKTTVSPRANPKSSLNLRSQPPISKMHAPAKCKSCPNSQSCGSVDLPAVLLVLSVQLVGLLRLLSHPAWNKLLVVFRRLPQLLLQRREGNLQGVVLILQRLVCPLQVLQKTTQEKAEGWLCTGTRDVFISVSSKRVSDWKLEIRSLPRPPPQPGAPRCLILSDVWRHTICKTCMQTLMSHLVWLSEVSTSTVAQL